MVIKPITSVIENILHQHGMWVDGDFSLKNGYVWISLANNVSVSISLYCLVLFYMATEERLAPFDPVPKFLCVKSILFFSYWQMCLFNIL